MSLLPVVVDCPHPFGITSIPSHAAAHDDGNDDSKQAQSTAQARSGSSLVLKDGTMRLLGSNPPLWPWSALY